MLTHLNPFSGGSHSKTLLQLIIITACASFGLALWDALISANLGWPYLTSYFTLSLAGIYRLFLWQIITYPFVMINYGLGLDLFYIISVLISLYILWVLGSVVFDHAGGRPLLQVYFTSSVVAGLCGLLVMVITGVSIPLSGPTAAILALFTIWTFLYPEVELLLFFVLPVRTKWLYAGVVGIIALLGISQLDFISLAYYFGALATGYLFCTLKWELTSPFEWTHGVDRRLINWGNRKRGTEKKSGKILEIFSGKPLLDDESFVEEMLQKISKKGQDSLTWAERKRLDEISRKREK